MKNKNKLLNYLPFIIVLLSVMSFFMFDPSSARTALRYDEFKEQVDGNTINEVVMTVDSNVVVLEGTYQDGSDEGVNFTTTVPNTEITTDQLLDELDKAEITIVDANASNALIEILSSIIPFIFFGLFAFYLLQKMNMGNSNRQAFEFSKSKARLEKDIKKRFSDVAGCDEEKEEMAEIIDYLKTPRKFEKMGARIPKGILLVGSPGTGKTLLAKAVAGEADVPFYSISGSDFVEMFVGVGAARVRNLFSLAKKNAPCILFLDELDAVGRHRGAGLGGGHDEREQTLNQILVEMDGFERETNVILLAATNRPDILDPALLRPGRFDRHVVLDRPDIEGRRDILKIHSKGKSLAKEVNLREIAERTPGFSGADLANLVNEAAILAARRNKKEITQDELRESIEKVLLGPERKSHILSSKEKKVTAYHEAGHALVASLMPESEPIQKVSIVARGLAAGYTLKLPTEEGHLKTKTQFSAELATLLGGYSAEKMIFKEVTTGASNDLRKATELARKLVMEYGMSKLGPIAFGKKTELVFLGKELGEQRNFSEKKAAQIDKEVERLIKESEKKAQKILKDNKDLLKEIAGILIRKETIERQEFEKIIREHKDRKSKKI